MRTRTYVLILLFVILLANLPGRAGTQNATVMGSVYFAGVGVPGVTVRLINASIGFSRVQTTGNDGQFTFTDVPPADNYLISVEKSGFFTKVLTDLAVQVGDEKLVIPPFLFEQIREAIQPVPQEPSTPEPARPSEVVTQTAPETKPAQAAPQAAPAAVAPQRTAMAPVISLNLLGTTEGIVIDTRWVHTLPLVNRDFIDLALLVPGTYPVEQGSVLQGASFVVNGARADMNNFLLDGADNNDYTINQSLPFQIIEALQEFRVQTSTSNAEFGRNGGAQINSVSRSGSNGFHGELFGFNRNSRLAAGNFFSAYNGGTFDQYAREESRLLGNGNPLDDPTLATLYDKHKPRVNQNQFGGDVGGSLIKDKLFGFFNWESFRLVNPRPVFEQVPGLIVRSADLCSESFGIGCDPTALALFNLYPSPNVPATAFTDPNSDINGAGAFNVGQSRDYTDSDNFLERVDWRLSSRTSMSFKHDIQRINQLQGGNVPASPGYPGNGTLVNGRNQNFSYNFVQQLTSRTTNEFRFGWNRFRLTTAAQDKSINPATLGFQNLNFTDQGPPTIAVEAPIFAAGGFTALGFTAPFSSLGTNFATPSNRADNVWSYADNISLNRGRHTLKFGGEFRHIRLNLNNGALGRGLITISDTSFAAALGLSGFDSIARICPPSSQAAFPEYAQSCSQFGSGFDRSFSTNSYSGFVQDQWRPWKNLTLNYGVRYEVNTAPVELRNRLVNYYPGLPTLLGVGGLVRSGSKTIFDPFGNVIGTALQSAPRGGFDTDYSNIGPRFGFAWDPMKDGKTVVRGAYALMFDQQPLEPTVNTLFNPPFLQQSLAPFLTALSDAFSVCPPGSADTGCQTTNPNSITDWFRFPYSITSIDPHRKTPYIHQFHFGVEQRLGNNTMVAVAYVGSTGHRLPMLRDISPCTPSTDLLSCLSNSAFFITDILEQENAANSDFNSLQVQVETRKLHGLQLRGFYQYAKSIDDSSSLQPQVFLANPAITKGVEALNFFPGTTVPVNSDFGGSNNISPTLSLQGDLPLITTRPRLPQDSSNLRGERARSDFDVKHRFVLNYIYEVPRWAPGIGSGWKLSGITTVQSGQPFTVYADSFGTPLRPNVLSPVRLNMSNPQAAIDNGIPVGYPGSALDLTPTFQNQPGLLGRNTFSGPKLINFDFGVLKNTRLPKTEKANLQFRVEFFNLFNNVNFRQPYSRAGGFFISGFTSSQNCQPSNTTLGFSNCFLPDPFFGQILQAFPARQIQLALKLSF